MKKSKPVVLDEPTAGELEAERLARIIADPAAALGKPLEDCYPIADAARQELLVIARGTADAAGYARFLLRQLIAAAAQDAAVPGSRALKAMAEWLTLPYVLGCN